MNERKIVSALLHDRSVLETVKPHVGELSPEALMISNFALEYYAADPAAKSVDLEILKGRIERAVQSNKLVGVLKETLDNLPSVSSVNVIRELVELKKHKIGTSLANKLLAGQHGADTDKLVETYLKMQGDSIDLSLSEVKPVTGIDIRNLIADATDETKLIKILPKQLNDRLDGGCRGGHHIVIVGRPEIGKTLVALNMAAGIIQQKKKVLWIENEEPIEDVLIRLGSRVSGMNKYEIRDNPEKAHKLISERVADYFTIVPLTPGTYQQVNSLTDKYKPAAVVINQMRNMDVRSENRTQSLEKASQSGRDLAKSRNVLVIDVTQAGDSANNKRVLEMGDIDGSNTGVQGPADVIFCIGGTQEDIERNIRWGSQPKNKRAGPQSHEPFQFFIDPTLSKIVEN